MKPCQAYGVCEPTNKTAKIIFQLLLFYVVVFFFNESTNFVYILREDLVYSELILP